MTLVLPNRDADRLAQVLDQAEHHVRELRDASEHAREREPWTQPKRRQAVA